MTALLPRLRLPAAFSPASAPAPSLPTAPPSGSRLPRRARARRDGESRARRRTYEQGRRTMAVRISFEEGGERPAGQSRRGRAMTRASSASGETALTAPTRPRDTIKRQSARAPERQSARAPERQSARAPERQSARAPERQSCARSAPDGRSVVTAPFASHGSSPCPSERRPARAGRRPPPLLSRFRPLGLARLAPLAACLLGKDVRAAACDSPCLRRLPLRRRHVPVRSVPQPG